MDEFGLVLAAGRGSRMGALTSDRPKCMIEFAGRSLLAWQMTALEGAGIGEIGIVGGHCAGAITAPPGSSLAGRWINAGWRTSDMVASLAVAAADLERYGHVTVVYGDLVVEPRLIRALRMSAADIAVVVDRAWLELWRLRMDDPLSDAESLSLGPDNRVLDLGRKVSGLAGIEGQYTGLLRFSRAGLKRFLRLWRDAGTMTPWLAGWMPAQAQMTDVLRGAIAAGETVAAAVVEGGWLEIDTAEDLAVYRRLLDEGRLAPRFTTADQAGGTDPW